MSNLPTNYVDDVLNADVNTRRKYQMIQNSDGTVSFNDVTDYDTVGSSIGAAQINAQNTKINQNTSAISTLNADLSAKQNKNWTLLGTFTGAGVHDLPANFSELIISVTTGGVANMIIPKAQLTTEVKQMWLTGVANGGQAMSCLFKVTLTTIDVNYIYWSGSYITSSTPYEVYYR
jgi:hypothetical protein